MIEVRRAESDADFEGWIRVKRAAFPNESAWTVQEFRERHASRTSSWLVAVLDGRDRRRRAGRPLGRARVEASSRRAFIPTPAAAGWARPCSYRLTGHVAGLGFDKAAASVDDEGSQAFAERFGFEEVDREVEQVIALPGGAAARLRSPTESKS